MMHSPESHIDSLKNMPMKELIKERAKLLSEIKKFEKDDLPSDAWLTKPSPDTIYLWNLEALALLCGLIAKRYSEEHEVSENL